MSSQPTQAQHSQLLAIEQLVAAQLQSTPLFAAHARSALEILGTLGEGGMGAVYKVLDRRTGRPAALKIILEDGDQPEARQRFLREARLTARLNHPGIPPVYEIGETARSELFLLMRLIEGMTIQELLLQNSKDSPEKHQRRIVKILIKVAEALACAHSQGVIHRDLKPANIMIGRFDEVLLMDWGVAKDLRASRDDKLISAPLSPEELEQTGLTLAGAIVGTPGYMAPEQARGEEIDQRADIYAFGLLLGEALCGQPLVSGESTLVRLVANTEGRHRPLEVLGPRLPRRLYWIVERCLDPDPDHRTNSIPDLIEQLQAYLADNDIPGYEPSIIERVQSPIRRRPFLTLVTLFFLAALALASTISTIQGRIDSATRARDQLEDERLNALKTAERSAEVLALLNEARRLSSRGITASLEETLDKAIQLSEQRSEVILEAARILVRSGFKERATTILQELADKKPPAFEALYELHLIAGYKDRQLSPPFLELIKRARELKIENEYSLFADGSKALAEGKDSMAQALFEKSLQRNQRLVPVLISLSLLEQRNGKLEAASALLDRAILADERAALAWSNRGNIRVLQNDRYGARSDFERAIELDPDSETTRLSRGTFRLSEGDLDGAVEDFQHVLKLNPEHPTLYTNLANAYASFKRFREAREAYDQAIRISPNDPNPWCRRGFLSILEKDNEAAERDLSKALELEPKHTLSLANRGLLRASLGQRAEAIPDLTECLKNEPDPRTAQQVKQALARLGASPP